MTTISATTILRSRNTSAPEKVLSTLLLRYPRFIHAEFMTHRVFSRNAASSRAIPVSKLIQDVMDNPAVPMIWGKNQKGMQSSEGCNEQVNSAPLLRADIKHEFPVLNRDAWLLARDNAVKAARVFAEAGYHKQICNRLLEPFAHITVLVSSTDWSNFLALRAHKDAEPHIHMLADQIRDELEQTDNIQDLEPGQWHLPFINMKIDADLTKRTILPSKTLTEMELVLELLIKKSVACCASTSYKTVDGFDMTLEKAIEIHDKLVGSAPLHASPAEHVAQADQWKEAWDDYGPWAYPHQHGNFTGFRQYRKMLPNECL